MIEIGLLDRRRQTRVQANACGPLIERTRQIRARQTAELLRILRCQPAIQQVDIIDAIAPVGVDDVLFAAEQLSVGIDGDQVRVDTVGDVLDDACGQAQQAHVVVDGWIELAIGQAGTRLRIPGCRRCNRQS